MQRMIGRVKRLIASSHTAIASRVSAPAIGLSCSTSHSCQGVRFISARRVAQQRQDFLETSRIPPHCLCVIIVPAIGTRFVEPDDFLKLSDSASTKSLLNGADAINPGKRLPHVLVTKCSALCFNLAEIAPRHVVKRAACKPRPNGAWRSGSCSDLLEHRRPSSWLKA